MKSAPLDASGGGGNNEVMKNKPTKRKLTPKPKPSAKKTPRRDFSQVA